MTLDRTDPDLATNLAIDEALLILAEDGVGPGASLRFWEMDRPAVVLGASCRLRENVRLEACRSDGVVLGRRSSGGGTVLLGPGALCVTIVRPLAALPEAEHSVDRSQRWVLDRTGEALQGLGPDVVMLGSGDLTLDGRKFVGSAQRRLRRHLMIHFSLLYDFDLALIDRYLQMPPRQPIYRQGRPHIDFVTNFPGSRAAIVGAIQRVWGTSTASAGGGWSGLQARAEELAQKKIRDDGWIERL